MVDHEPGCRALHLVGSNRDFAEACELASGGSSSTNWVLGMRRPGPEITLPANVEWIRLPREFENQSAPESLYTLWARHLGTLFETFLPEIVYVHRGFLGAWPGDADDLIRALPQSVYVEIVDQTGGMNRNSTREAS